ncbi:MAG: sigma-70 family RNA polymerase sigma factor, partial [Spirochaetes bacterium]|nr:sigma-70 family RNA polymerase sigma factor [Spirochaetota bacterium]
VYLTIVKDHFKLLRKFDSESRPAFLVYLKRIAENTAKNFLRKHRIQTVELGEALNELADERKNAEAVLLIEADMETLRSAIRSLRKDYRNVVELLLKGYRHREIAEILEIPLKTSLTWAHRAVADLRKKLKIEIISDHEHILS